MLKIPLFQERAEISAQAAGAQARGADATSQALGQLGGVVSDIGIQMAQRMEQSTTEAQSAKYLADRKLRWSEFQKEAATMSDPEEIGAFYKKWSESESKVFEGTKLTRRARGAVGNSNTAFYADADIAVNGVNGLKTKAAIAQNDRTWIELQQLALNGESYEDPETGQILDSEQLYEYATNQRMSLGTVGTEEGIKAVEEFGSKSKYFEFMNEIEVLENEYLKGNFSKEEYLGRLEEISTEVRDADMRPNHSNPVFNTAIARQNGVMRKEGTKAQKSFNAWIKAMEEDNLSAATNKILADGMGQEYMNAAIVAMKESMVGKITSNPDAKKIIELIDTYNKGEASYVQTIRKINEKGGDLSFQGLLWLGHEVDEDVKAGKQIEAYEKVWVDQQMPTTGRHADLIRSTLPLLTEDTNSAEINKILSKGNEIINLKPDMDDDEWQEAKSQILRGNAKQMIKSLKVPTTKILDEKPPREGAIRAPDGRWVVQENGQWYEVTQ